jgi:hypothetical protein
MRCRSTFNTIMEAQCFQGIVDWMNNAGSSKKFPHGRMTSWFYWAYNPDSGGVPRAESLQTLTASVGLPQSAWEPLSWLRQHGMILIQNQDPLD